MIKKNFFAPRIVNVWNSLLEILISADTTDTYTDDLLANHVKHKGEMYRDGMLRGREVSKD